MTFRTVCIVNLGARYKMSIYMQKSILVDTRSYKIIQLRTDPPKFGVQTLKFHSWYHVVTKTLVITHNYKYLLHEAAQNRNVGPGRSWWLNTGCGEEEFENRASRDTHKNGKQVVRVGLISLERIDIEEALPPRHILGQHNVRFKLHHRVAHVTTRETT